MMNDEENEIKGAEITPRYIKGAKLGNGSFGNVYIGYDKLTKSKIALKYSKDIDLSIGLDTNFLREVSIMKSLNHVNLLPLRDAIITDKDLIIVMDYLDFSLSAFLMKRKGPLPPDLLRSYAFQLLCGIYYMHTHRVMHRDLKPDNILLDTQGHLKINDFGLSRYFSIPLRKYTQFNITNCYGLFRFLTFCFFSEKKRTITS